MVYNFACGLSYLLSVCETYLGCKCMLPVEHHGDSQGAIVTSAPETFQMSFSLLWTECFEAKMVSIVIRVRIWEVLVFKTGDSLKSRFGCMFICDVLLFAILLQSQALFSCVSCWTIFLIKTNQLVELAVYGDWVRIDRQALVFIDNRGFKELGVS